MDRTAIPRNDYLDDFGFNLCELYDLSVMERLQETAPAMGCMERRDAVIQAAHLFTDIERDLRVMEGRIFDGGWDVAMELLADLLVAQPDLPLDYEQVLTLIRRHTILQPVTPTVHPHLLVIGTDFLGRNVSKAYTNLTLRQAQSRFRAAVRKPRLTVVPQSNDHDGEQKPTVTHLLVSQFPVEEWHTA